jgi:GT2 family glycosyltransferase
MELPRFTIVIPTFNRPERLADCLASLARLEYPSDRFEALVVDDGSEPIAPVEDAVRAVRDPLTVRLVRQEHAGPAAARNLGAKSAAFEYLAFTDDDCRPDPGWLRGFAGRFAASPGCVAGGRTRNALVDNTYSAASQALVSYLYRYSFEKGEPFVASNNIALSREVFDRIGGFDDRFPLAGGEDRDFCDRCLAGGVEIAYAPEASIRHYHALDLRRFLRQHYAYGRGAWSYHTARAARGAGRVRFEPFRFYRDLVRHPFVSDEGRRRWAMSGLLLVSQAVNAAGYFFEKLRRKPSGDPRAGS